MKIKEVKIFMLTIITISILLGLALYLCYKWGKTDGDKECKEKEVQVKTETVEVVKYIYKDDAKIYIRPNSTLDELIRRMEKGEI